MRKSIKWLGAFVSILILLVVLVAVCLVTFVSPNRFKPLIAEQVMKYTGRQLTIDGDLSWSLFPYLGVKTGHILLSNPSGFEQKIFAEIQHATIGVKLFPLLHKKIESSGIVLDGLKLNLIRDGNGKNNWQFKQISPISTSTAVVATDPSRTSALKKLSVELAISGIEISNAEINWTDQQKEQSGRIEKFGLRAKDISFLKPFPMESEFNFTSKNPAISGHVALTSETSLSIDQQIFSFRKLALTAQLQQEVQKFSWTVKGDVIADLQQQTLQWTHFYGQMGNLILIGKMGVVDLITNPHATGHLQIQPFDLKELLQSVGQEITNMQVLKDMSGDVDFTAAANTVDVQGKFKIDTIEAKHVKLSQVIFPLHYQIGVLELSPITADFYQGSLQTNAKVNLTGALPQIAMQGKLLNVHTEPLLQDLDGNNQKLKLVGIGNMEWQITTMGPNANAFVKNLNGKAHVSFNQGILQGIDIGYLLDSAYAFAKQKTLTTANARQTDFGSLIGSVVFRDGIIINDDLLFDSQRFKSSGKGSIDLVNQKIDFHLQTVVNQSAMDQRDDWGNLYGLPIPIDITGRLADPTIRLDTTVLAKAVAEQQIKKIETKVQDKIKDKVQGKAGELLQNLLDH